MWQEVLQPLGWCCIECVIHHKQDVHKEQHQTGCAQRTTPIYMWHEQAIIEWLQHVISIVALFLSHCWIPTFTHHHVGIQQWERHKDILTSGFEVNS